jgi:hypothetical protein
MADSLGISESDRVMPIARLFHAWGWGMPYGTAMTGAEIVVHGRDTSADNIGSIIERERITVAGAVPTIWKELLPLAREGKYDLSSLRLVFVGGSASPRSLIEAYRELGINYTQVWGMTETGPIACVAKPRRGVDDVLDYTGTITPGVEGRVVDGELQRPCEQVARPTRQETERHVAAREHLRHGSYGPVAAERADQVGSLRQRLARLAAARVRLGRLEPEGAVQPVACAHILDGTPLGVDVLELDRVGDDRDPHRTLFVAAVATGSTTRACVRRSQFHPSTTQTRPLSIPIVTSLGWCIPRYSRAKATSRGSTSSRTVRSTRSQVCRIRWDISASE